MVFNSFMLFGCFVYLAASSVFCAYTSHKWSTTGSTVWAVVTYSMNLIPLWIVIAKYSDNLLRDSLIYDLVLTIVFTAALLYFQSRQISFTVTQIVGICLALLGIILFKLEI